jgi:serine/threonine protein kinase
MLPNVIRIFCHLRPVTQILYMDMSYKFSLFACRYNYSVDYWSLGLVSHEVITGVRPFLPNMAPVSW